MNTAESWHARGLPRRSGRGQGRGRGQIPPAPGREVMVGTGYSQGWETISLAAVPGHTYLA